MCQRPSEITRQQFPYDRNRIFSLPSRLHNPYSDFPSDGLEKFAHRKATPALTAHELGICWTGVSFSIGDLPTPSGCDGFYVH